MLEKLKNNLAKYHSLSEDEQQYLLNIGKNNCLILMFDGTWGEPNYTKLYDELFNNEGRYRIKPDYQEPKKPQDEYIEIKISNTDYPEYYVTVDGRLFELYKIVCMPMFCGYCYKKNKDIWQAITSWDIYTKMKCNQKCFVKINR
jgi:hypothetical protein